MAVSTLTDRHMPADTQLAEYQPPTLAESLDRYRAKFAQALPAGASVDEFVASLGTAVAYNPDLTAIANDPARRDSLWGAAFTAAQLGLMPTKVLGHVWFIPRYDYRSKLTLCTFQLGYKGLVELARRTGHVGQIVLGHAWPDEITADEAGLTSGRFGVDFRIRERVDRPIYPDYVPASEAEFDDPDSPHDPNVVFYAIVEVTGSGSSFVKKMSARAAYRHYCKTHEIPGKQFKGRRNASDRAHTAWDGWYAEMAAISAFRSRKGTLEMSLDMTRALENELTFRTNLEHEAIDFPKPVEVAPANRAAEAIEAIALPAGLDRGLILEWLAAHVDETLDDATDHVIVDRAAEHLNVNADQALAHITEWATQEGMQ